MLKCIVVEYLVSQVITSTGFDATFAVCIVFHSFGCRFHPRDIFTCLYHKFYKPSKIPGHEFNTNSILIDEQVISSILGIFVISSNPILGHTGFSALKGWSSVHFTNKFLQVERDNIGLKWGNSLPMPSR